MLKAISTDNAPAAIGTYSQAVRYNDLLFISGQIGMDPQTGILVSNAFDMQARQAFENLKAIIEAAGSDLSKVIKLNISVIDMSKFACFNAIMEQFFYQPYPARAVVGVAELPKGACVEIEAIVAV